MLAVTTQSIPQQKLSLKQQLCLSSLEMFTLELCIITLMLTLQIVMVTPSLTSFMHYISSYSLLLYQPRDSQCSSTWVSLWLLSSVQTVSFNVPFATELIECLMWLTVLVFGFCKVLLWQGKATRCQANLFHQSLISSCVATLTESCPLHCQTKLRPWQRSCCLLRKCLKHTNIPAKIPKKNKDLKSYQFTALAILIFILILNPFLILYFAESFLTFCPTFFCFVLFCFQLLFLRHPSGMVTK